MTDTNRSKFNIWQFFTATKNNAATWNKCGKTMKRSPGNISNLITHLKHMYMEDWKTFHELDEWQKYDVELTAQTWVRKQPTITNMMEQCMLYSDDNPKVQRFALTVRPFLFVTTGC